MFSIINVQEKSSDMGLTMSLRQRDNYVLLLIDELIKKSENKTRLLPEDSEERLNLFTSHLEF